MLPAFTSFELGLVINFAVFVATLAFSTKIKDWFRGVPSDLRKGISGVEASVLADVKNYQSQLIAKIVPAPAPVVKPDAPAPLDLVHATPDPVAPPAMIQG